MGNDALLSITTMHAQKPRITEKSCRFSKWCHSAWATLSWNGAAGRRGVSRTEDGERFTPSKTQSTEWCTDCIVKKFGLKEDGKCRQHENSPSAAVIIILFANSHQYYVFLICSCCKSTCQHLKNEIQASKLLRCGKKCTHFPLITNLVTNLYNHTIICTI